MDIEFTKYNTKDRWSSSKPEDRALYTVTETILLERTELLYESEDALSAFWETLLLSSRAW